MPLRAARDHRHLLTMLLRRDVASRSAETMLGFAWLFVQPLLMIVAFWFLIDVVLQVRFPGRVAFVDYFLIAILPWLMWVEIVTRSANVMPEHEAVFQKTRFPLTVLPLVPLLTAGFFYGVVYLIVVAMVAGLAVIWWVPILWVALLLWLLPFVYLTAILGAFLRDVRQIIPVVLSAGLFLSPILYMPEMMPASLVWTLSFNPVADWMAVIHASLLGLPLESASIWRLLVWWVLALAPAYVLFHRTEGFVREAL